MCKINYLFILVYKISHTIIENPFCRSLLPFRSSPMEPVITSSGDSSDLFFDAFDVFYTPDLTENVDLSASSTPGRTGNKQENEGPSTIRREVSSTSLLRRRASSRSTVPRINSDANDPSFESHDNFDISTFRERRSNTPLNLEVGAISNDGETSTSTLTSVQYVAGRNWSQDTSSLRDESSPPVNEYPSQRLLVSLADLVIKAIFFQVNMLIRCSEFLIWLTYNSLLFVFNPFGTLKHTIDDMKRKILWVSMVVPENFSPFVPEMLKGEHGIGQLAGRLAWGCFLSFYIGIVLFGLLVTGFLCAYLLMSRIVEEPLHMTRNLNFDYTKANPDTLVHLMPCNDAGCSLEFHENVRVFKPAVRRVIPPSHKLQLTISLSLPESDYNRNLGVFQVRVEFLSIKGKVTSGLSKSCMLRFKSPPIRLMETFIKSSSLLAGYSSESQVVDLELSGYTEGSEPTVCIRIVLKQRAEYRPGAGIPEIYAASLKLESKLPLLKRMIWSWRRTLLIWSAMGFFIWEVLIILVCCRPVLFPFRRRINNTSTSSS